MKSIVYTRDDLARRVKRLTGGKGVDVIYDSVGATTFLKGLDLLRPRGMMALFGQSSGPVEPINPYILNPKGSLFLTRPSLAHYVLTREELLWRAGDVLNWIGSGRLKLLIDRTYTLREWRRRASRSRRPQDHRQAAPDSLMTIEENRRARAAELVADKKLDALLVTNLHNVRYLTGFTGSNGAVLLRKDAAATLFSDPRYTVQSKQQANCGIKIAKGPLTKSIVREIAAKRVPRVGFEADNMTVSQLGVLQKDLPTRAKLEPASGLIERLRAVKDADEVAKIRASVLSNSAAIEAALKRLKSGMTESEFSAEIDYQNRQLGAEGPAFDTIVAAGERAALPHAHPGSDEDRPRHAPHRYGSLPRRICERHDAHGAYRFGHP